MDSLNALMSNPPRPTAWGYFWLAWLMTGGVIELYWVFLNSANTLSDQIWGIEMIDFSHPLDLAEWNPLHWILAIVLWVFFAWLSVHFPFGYLR